jgi:hypothetical protein
MHFRILTQIVMAALVCLLAQPVLAGEDSHFQKRDTYLTYTVGYARGDDGENMGFNNIGIGYFVRDDVSVNWEFFGAYIDQPFVDDFEERGLDDGDFDTPAWGFWALVRWHFWEFEKITIYGDLGVGFIRTYERLPDRGTTENFTPQAGMGFTYAWTDRIKSMTGLRYLHVSNAEQFEPGNPNPGLESAYLYSGLMWLF